MLNSKLKLFGPLAVSAMAALAGTAMPVRAADLKALPVTTLRFALKNSGTIKLFESLAGKEVQCKAVTGNGEFTAERKGTMEFRFTECKLSGVNCTGLEDGTAGSVTYKAEFDLRHLLPSTEGVALAILLGHVHLACLVALFLVLGCLASMTMLDKNGGESLVNKAVEKAFVSFLEEKGNQKPTSIDSDGSLSMEECVAKVKEGSGEYESSGQLLELELEKFEQVTVGLLVELTGTF